MTTGEKEYCMDHKERIFVSGQNCSNIKEIETEIDNKVYPAIVSKLSIKTFVVIFGFLLAFLGGSFMLLYNQSFENGKQIERVLSELTTQIARIDINQRLSDQRVETFIGNAPPPHHHSQDGTVVK